MSRLTELEDVFIMKITESASLSNDQEKMTVKEILTGINNEDAKVHLAVQKEIPKIGQLVGLLFERVKNPCPVCSLIH